MRWVIRFGGLILGGALGYQLGDGVVVLVPRLAGLRLVLLGGGLASGAALGSLLAVWVWRRFESAMGWVLGRLAHVSLRDVGLGVLGLGSGLLLAALVGFPLSRIPGVGNYLALTAALVLGYLGYHLVMQRRDEVAGFLRLERGGRPGVRGRGVPKVLDTSVIIDGRVADVVRAGFLEGPLLVPRSVLHELQRIADSSDTLRRNRGRRGLDILHRLQEELQAVQIVDDPKDAGDADAALVALARAVRGWIVTNDYNLNKVAALQGIRVLNINELSQALRPVVLPGEELTVQVIRDGKEAGQGVGYLEDGTMVVVEGGKKYIGETSEVVVTSVLQTVAGRMIFGRPKDAQGTGGTSGQRR
ncbi:MAG: TRAM domain-containing protein [Armatimonadota bacterium]|nr:TRAM domain-containing protein [Armatimonadota bacterium]MDR7472340.1 TRAM domain-containing protein [Armatimonadota bacterium]